MPDPLSIDRVKVRLDVNAALRARKRAEECGQPDPLVTVYASTVAALCDEVEALRRERRATEAVVEAAELMDVAWDIWMSDDGPVPEAQILGIRQALDALARKDES
jgi:hypothetical protein